MKNLHERLAMAAHRIEECRNLQSELVARGFATDKDAFAMNIVARELAELALASQTFWHEVAEMEVRRGF